MVKDLKSAEKKALRKINIAKYMYHFWSRDEHFTFGLSSYLSNFSEMNRKFRIMQNTSRLLIHRQNFRWFRQI